MYPRNQKIAWTVEGVNLRKIAKLDVYLHISMSFMSLAYIGFYPMLLNIIYALLSFSVYLTLRELVTVLYIVSISTGFVLGFLGLFEYTFSDSI